MDRYILCLDESGSFEPGNANEVSFIAGFLYKEGDANGDWDSERQALINALRFAVEAGGLGAIAHQYLRDQVLKAGTRVANDAIRRQYVREMALYLSQNPGCAEIDVAFEARCNTVGVPRTGFPGCLHTTTNAARVNELLAGVTAEHMSGVNAIRPGTYQPFAIFRRNGVCNATGNPLTDDRYYFNLYNNMLDRMLRYSVFLNPCVPDEADIALDVPTRVYPEHRQAPGTSQVGTELHERVSGLLKQNYEVQYVSCYGGNVPIGWEKTFDENPIDWREIRFSVVNAHAIRASLRESLTKYPGIRVDPDTVRPNQIDYSSRADVLREAGRYAADILCGDIRRMLKQHGNRFKLESLARAINNRYGSEPLLFEYLPGEDVWRMLMEALQQRRVPEMLDSLYGLTSSKARTNAYYSRVLFGMVPKERLIPFAIRSALEEGYDHANRLFNASKYNPARFILEWLYKGKVELDGFGGEELLQYKYACLLMHAAQHAGDVKAGKFYGLVCEKLYNKIDNMTLLQSRVISVANLENTFDFEAAETEAAQIYDAYVRVADAQRSILGALYNPFSPDYACAAGKYSQVLAFRGKNGSVYFDQALRLWPPGDAENIRRSTSFLLHFAIAAGKRKLYEKHEAAFFGVEESLCRLEKLMEALKRIRDAGWEASRFPLYVYLKALYIFYLDDLLAQPEPMPAELIDLLSCIKATSEPASHPFELIYKYLALILYKAGFQDAAKERIDWSEIEKSGDSTIRALQYGGRIEYGLATGDLAMQLDALDGLRAFVLANPAYQKHFACVLSTGCKPKAALELFTYMYR